MVMTEFSVLLWAAECSRKGAVLKGEVRDGLGEGTVLGEGECSGSCSGERAMSLFLVSYKAAPSLSLRAWRSSISFLCSVESLDRM